MQSAAELFTFHAKSVTVGLAEPCAVLIENSEEHFGLLLAESCTHDSWSPELRLHNTLYFRASRHGCQYRVCPEILLSTSREIFHASDSNALLPNCSQRPFALSFMPREEYERLLAQFRSGQESILFRWTQNQFGKLPGFAAIENTLTTPPDYANIAPDRRDL